jgi:hypothetical protein
VQLTDENYCRFFNPKSEIRRLFRLRRLVAQARARWFEQRPGKERACKGRVLQPFGRNARSQLRKPALPGQRPQLGRGCYHSLEHGLLGTRDSLPERTWIDLRREPAPTRITTGLGTHQTHGRLRLAPKQARNLNPVATSQLKLCRSSSTPAAHRIMSLPSRPNSIPIGRYCEKALGLRIACQPNPIFNVQLN